MIHTLERTLEIARKVIETNRRKGKTTNLIIRDDTVKARIGERRLTTVIQREEIVWK